MKTNLIKFKKIKMYLEDHGRLIQLKFYINSTSIINNISRHFLFLRLQKSMRTIFNNVQNLSHINQTANQKTIAGREKEINLTFFWTLNT